MQQPTDQSVGQSKDVPRQYLDTALEHKIYCLAMAFDPPTQSVTYIHIHCLKLLQYTGVESAVVIGTRKHFEVTNMYKLILS